MKKSTLERERWFLRYLIIFPLHRYMMCNAYGRLDGHEKATIHIEISEKISAFVLCEGAPREMDTFRIKVVAMDVHDFLADLFTDSMDEAIGFIINKTLYGDSFELFANRALALIIFHMNEIEDIIFNKLEEEEIR